MIILNVMVLTNQLFLFTVNLCRRIFAIASCLLGSRGRLTDGIFTARCCSFVSAIFAVERSKRCLSIHTSVCSSQSCFVSKKLYLWSDRPLLCTLFCGCIADDCMKHFPCPSIVCPAEALHLVVICQFWCHVLCRTQYSRSFETLELHMSKFIFSFLTYLFLELLAPPMESRVLKEETFKSSHWTLLLPKYILFCRLLMYSSCITVLGTCEASWFESISNRMSDSRFDSYWWSGSKFSNRPRCQSSFVKKQLVVVKFAFKVDFGSKISVQQHCLMRFMTELK